MNIDAKRAVDRMLTAPLPILPPIELIPFAEIKLGTKRRYLINGLIPRVGLIVLWGPPKCGKSFWIFDLSMHVALNWKYRGLRSHGGPVIYCCFEGQTGMEARVEAFRQRFLSEDHDDIPFFLQPVTLDLVNDHPALITAIKEHNLAPVMVVLDTLNRSLRGSESSDQDMSAYIRAADAIREAFNCAVVVVHHCGINGSRPRGHTSLQGACDAQLAVTRDINDNIIVTVEEMKDGPRGDVVASRLDPIEVGVDEDGEKITSCVVVEAQTPLARNKAARWSRGLTVFHEAAVNALLEHGRDHRPAGDGPVVKACFVTDARVEHKRLYVHNGEGDRSEAERKAWTRALKTARGAHLISGENVNGQDLIWLMS
jgi:AAA domain